MTTVPRILRSRPYPLTFTRKLSTANPLPAHFLRGGTSKGIFISRSQLPTSPDAWTPIFAGILGSPDPWGRQLNGMGGGISSLSKIMVVGPPDASRKDSADLDYTFTQVGVRDGVMDRSGNCGNLTSAAPIFALDAGIVKPRPGENKRSLRMFNTNTQKTIVASFPTASETGLPDLEKPETSIVSVSGEGSRITLDFLDPAGSRTGKLLPTGNPIDVVRVEGVDLPITCIDATNPSVFVSLSSLSELLVSEMSGADFVTASFPHVQMGQLGLLEQVREAGAKLMGLDPYAQAQPKICILASDEEGGCDVVASTLSMGVPHKAIPVTVALGIAAAAGVEGSLVRQFEKGKLKELEMEEGRVALRIKIPGGVVCVTGRVEGGVVKSVGVERTARRLMRGEVFW